MMFYENTNRPDAGLYHLPYIKTIIENKITFGLTNVHFRFGHVSIIQYVSAPYYYGSEYSNGISVPLSIIFIIFIIYFIEIFITKKNSELKKIISFFFIFSCLYGMNRYSGMGNDVPAHIFFFLVVYHFLTFSLQDKNYYSNFEKQILYASFCFLCKPMLITIFLLPLFTFFKCLTNFKITRIILFSIFLVLFWLLKNFIVSSCLLYPSNITCFETSWSSHNSIQANPKYIEELGEAWSKDFPNRDNKSLDYESYNKNYNWVKTWTKNHLKIVFENLTINILFFLLLIFKVINITLDDKKTLTYSKILYFLFFCLISLFLWFNKFPIYRYGESILITTILFIVIVCLKFISSNNIFKYNYLKNIIFLLIILIISKNVLKIKNFDQPNYKDSPWPKQNSYTKENNEIILDPVLNNEGKVIYFKPSNDSVCMFSKSPCTNLDPGYIKLVYLKFNYKLFKTYNPS